MPAETSVAVGAGTHAGADRRRVGLIVLLGALSAFAPLSIDMYLPALPRLARDFSVHDSQVQLTLTTCIVGLAIGQALAGPLSDAFGRRRPLLIGLVAYAVASVLCAFASSVYALAALRLVQGLAGAAGIVIARAVVRDMHSGVAMARFFSLLMLVNGVAPIAAPVLGGQMLRVTSWRGVFVVLALIGLALLVASAFGLRETLPVERRRSGGVRDALRAFRTLGRDRLFIGYTLSGGLAFAAMFAYISGSPFVLQQVYGLTAQQFSLAFGTNALGIVLAGQVSGALVSRLGPARLLWFGLTGCACGGVALLSAVVAGAGLPFVLPALFLMVASQGLILPNVAALALAGHPDAAGTASALVGLLQFVIGGIAAPLVGLGGAHTAVPMGIVVAVLAVSASVVCAAMTRVRQVGVVR